MAAKRSLIERLSAGVVFGDGAMGTMLYQSGVFLNSCFDELNISRPQLIEKVHRDYVNAGVDFIETNTFGANEFKLGQFGLANDVEKINESAVEIAKKTTNDTCLIAGSIGPLGWEHPGYDNEKKQIAAEAFCRQAKTLISGGVDFLILETFSNTSQLLIAIQAIGQISDIPIVAQMTFDENNETIYGERIEQAISRIASEDRVTAVGLNCSVGPAGMLDNLSLIRNLTDKPISVQPNAGLPRRVENRAIYMCTPEYMAEYAKRFYEKGAKIIGGCCGTTPEHIRQIVKAVTALNKADSHGKIINIAAQAGKKIVEEKVTLKTLAEKSKLGQKICSPEPAYLIELTPPRGVDLTATIEKAKLCKEMGIDAINLPDGPRASSRLSPMITAVKIQQEARIETLLHFCCRDRNLIGMQSDMLGAHAIGLQNMLIITGDPPKLGEYPDATGVFDLDSIALTGVLANLNRGVDIGGNCFSPGTCLSIGIGANPVAADMRREIERFRLKVQAGAEYAITQPVFDVQMFFDFLEAIKDFRIPVIAGIWPFTSYKNAEFMANEVPGVCVPKQLLKRMEATKTKQQGTAMGIQIAHEMIEQIKTKVAGFAVSAPFGNVRIALSVLGKIDIKDV